MAADPLPLPPLEAVWALPQEDFGCFLVAFGLASLGLSYVETFFEANIYAAMRQVVDERVRLSQPVGRRRARSMANLVSCVFSS